MSSSKTYDKVPKQSARFETITNLIVQQITTAMREADRLEREEKNKTFKSRMKNLSLSSFTNEWPLNVSPDQKELIKNNLKSLATNGDFGLSSEQIINMEQELSVLLLSTEPAKKIASGERFIKFDPEKVGNVFKEYKLTLASYQQEHKGFLEARRLQRIENQQANEAMRLQRARVQSTPQYINASYPTSHTRPTEIKGGSAAAATQPHYSESDTQFELDMKKAMQLSIKDAREAKHGRTTPSDLRRIPSSGRISPNAQGSGEGKSSYSLSRTVSSGRTSPSNRAPSPGRNNLTMSVPGARERKNSK